MQHAQQNTPLNSGFESGDLTYTGVTNRPAVGLPKLEGVVVWCSSQLAFVGVLPCIVCVVSLLMKLCRDGVLIFFETDTLSKKQAFSLFYGIS